MNNLRQAAERMLEVMHRQGYVGVDEWIAAEKAIRAALAEQPALTATYTCGVCGVSMQMEQPAGQEPVAWSVFDKRTKKHWYTHESRYTAQHYANEYSHREPDGTPHNIVVPLYTAPQPRKRLTEAEIDAIWRTHLHRDSRVRAIEDAIWGEKT